MDRHGYLFCQCSSVRPWLIERHTLLETNMSLPNYPVKIGAQEPGMMYFPTK